MSNHFEWFEDEFEDGESYTDMIIGEMGVMEVVIDVISYNI